jgi:hypothetical protein
MMGSTVRRLYFYVAAFIGLQLFVAGARLLLEVLFEAVFLQPAVGDGDQTLLSLSSGIALVLVGAGLWAIHWIVAQRGQTRDDDRRSTLRRLYLYAVLVVAGLTLLFAAQTALRNLLGIGSLLFDGDALARASASLLVNAAVFGYHWRVAAANRVEVETHGGTATLRRWFLVILSVFGLGMAAYAASDVLYQLLRLTTVPAIGTNTGIRTATASLVAGLAAWVPTYVWGQRLLRAPGPLQADEARSVLRQVYGGLVIVVSAVAALGALVIFLQEAMLALFGDAAWSAVFGEHQQAIATTCVAIPVWLFHSALLGAEARATGTVASVLTARRIVLYLMAAVGLGTLFWGLGGLLSTLLRYAADGRAVLGDWRDPLAWSLALSIVALPVYSWAARTTERLALGSPVEERTLARRIYLYAALLFGIITTIVAVVQLVRLLLGAVLGVEQPRLLTDLALWGGYAVIGSAIGYYHLVLVRRAGDAREEPDTTPIAVALVVEPSLGERLTALLRRELPAADLRVALPGDAAATDAALAGADVLVLSFGALFERATAATLHRFAKPKLLVPTQAPDYDVLGADRGDDVWARETLRALRAHIAASRTEEAAPPPETRPSGAVDAAGAT